MRKVLVIGGVAGGASAAARLRRLDEHANIIMFERGEYISYANCGLPYYIGGDIKDRSALTLQTPESFKSRFNVDVRIFNEVISINPNDKNVEVKDHRTGKIYVESYDKLILSPGAEAVRPNIKGFDNARVFTLRNIPDTYRIKDYINQEKPKSAVVVGGGYIGIEMAENLKHAGLDVTVVEFADHVIAPLDFDMASDVHNHIREKGVHLILGDGVKEITDQGAALKITLGKQDIYADMVIMSVGVRPDSTLAKIAGLSLNERGAIIVDEHMRTSDDSIYAVGDAVEITDYITGTKGYIPLAGPANKQGRIAADNICGIETVYKGTQGSGILKCFDLTVATTGITEKQAKTLNLNYEKSFTYSASHASYYPGAVSMSIKLIFHKDNGKILGAQIVGYEGVDKRLDVLATAIRANMTVYDLTELELAYAPPFSSAKDPVNMAGYVAENILTGKTRIFHFDEVDKLPRDGSVTLLDIRSDMEYENGSIDGFMNITVDELRKNLHRLDKSKPVYVTCQIGLRGHTACRILSQNGFECYNLSGGYRLYNSIYHKAEQKGQENYKLNEETMVVAANITTVEVDACGLQCPGPIMKLSEAVKNASEGDVIEIKTTDPAFAADVESWCKRTGNTFGGVHSEKGISKAIIKKGGVAACVNYSDGNNKNIIVFSGDLDKAIASFIIANTAASMGRKVTMFFTFWGLNILRKPEKVSVKKDIISKMFGAMMPRGSKKLGLSKMNMGGMGAKMIRMVMKNKNIDDLESLIKASIDNGVELIACSMSMDVMGITMDELIDGVKISGAATMLANGEESDMSLFI
ncbi:CoA-disulfide reductase [Mobilisporobacter senegalensis]|uniref:CoA-disulfide reductase n=1 Tax=Mobilisporobacter senegalensis TaxID=1329262 RepID=A0A3N1XVI9_9FIRM|nr:CoA-disulfide reductase [Mobilisporobacter senegalensis]ROR30629.1 CoA-disulfide reductase [Mobilisporobacter senegalensis]